MKELIARKINYIETILAKLKSELINKKDTFQYAITRGYIIAYEDSLFILYQIKKEYENIESINESMKRLRGE